MLSSLGAAVELYLDNEQLLGALKKQRNVFDIIVTNKRHFTVRPTATQSGEHDAEAGLLLIEALRDQHVSCPIIVYSRTLNKDDQLRFQQLHVFASVTYPEDFIHSVLQAADELRRSENLARISNASRASAQADPSAASTDAGAPAVATPLTPAANSSA